MADTFLPLFLAMIQLMCVIVVAAYLLTRSRFFASVLDGHPVLKVQAFLILFFGALSIYGTMGGIEIMGAVINVRDLGPIVGGLVGGPVVGLGAGLADFRLGRGQIGHFHLESHAVLSRALFSSSGCFRRVSEVVGYALA